MTHSSFNISGVIMALVFASGCGESKFSDSMGKKTGANLVSDPAKEGPNSQNPVEGVASQEADKNSQKLPKSGPDAKPKAELLAECLNTFGTNIFSQEEKDRAIAQEKVINLKNGNGTELFVDKEVTDKPKLVLVSILASHNLNHSAVKLLNPKGYYCVTIQSEKNINRFEIVKKCGSDAKQVHVTIDAQRNDKNTTVTCIP